MTAKETFPVDVVIIAYGFKANPASWYKRNNIETDENGLVLVRDKFLLARQTSLLVAILY